MRWVLKAFDELSTAELYEILKIRTDVFVVEQTCPYPELDGKDPESYHLYGIEGEEIVAYLRILPKGVSYDEISIGRVLVVEGARGRGYGRQLMKEALRIIEEDFGETTIRLSAQAYLEAFYTEIGFKRVSPTYVEDGIPHMDMLYEKA